ncbi:unnamed protein product, partial [Staurois parvus]
NAGALTSLAVFPSVARGKVSAPQAVTPSYTLEYLAALLRDLFFTYLVLRSHDVPRAVSPGNVLRPMPASVFQVPFLATSGCMGTELVGNFKILKVTFTKFTKTT